MLRVKRTDHNPTCMIAQPRVMQLSSDALSFRLARPFGFWHPLDGRFDEYVDYADKSRAWIRGIHSQAC